MTRQRIEAAGKLMMTSISTLGCFRLVLTCSLSAISSVRVA